MDHSEQKVSSEEVKQMNISMNKIGLKLNKFSKVNLGNPLTIHSMFY